MTKKEQREVESKLLALQVQLTEARVLAALRWTDEVKPDLPIPTWQQQELSKGWIPVAAGSCDARVERACSSSTSHNVGRDDRTTNQTPIRLYSTKLLALRALRVRAERVFAGRLHEIDTMIAGEIAGEKQETE